MKRFYIILVSFLLVCFLVSCSIEKEVVYETVIKHQKEEGGAEIYDKVLVYKLRSKLHSKKDSICYYKNGKYLGTTIIKIDTENRFKR